MLGGLYTLIDMVTTAEAASGTFVFEFADVDNHFVVPDGEKRGFVLTATLKDAPTSVLGMSFGFHVAALQGQGVSSGLATTHSQIGLTLSPRTITLPSGTLDYQNGYPLNAVLQSCLPDLQAGAVAFQVRPRFSEALVWRAIGVEGSSWNGATGLADGVSNVFFFRDGGAFGNRELDGSDWLLTNLEPGTHVFEDAATALTMQIAPELADAQEGFAQLGVLTRYVVGARVHATAMGPDEEASYTFHIRHDDLVLVGADSGDPATLTITSATPRFRELRPGVNVVRLSNAQTPAAEPRFALNGHTITPLSLYMYPTGIETARLVDMTARISLTGTSAPLEEVVAPDFQLFGRASTSSSTEILLAHGTANLDQEFIHLTANDLITDSEWPLKPFGSNFSLIELRLHVLPDAPEGATIQLQLDDADAIRFEASCPAAGPDVESGLSRIDATFPLAGQAITIQPRVVRVTLHEPPVGGVESYPFNAGTLEGDSQLISRFRIASKTDHYLTLRGFDVKFDAQTLPFDPGGFVVHVENSDDVYSRWGIPQWEWNAESKVLEVGIADLVRSSYDVRIFAKPNSEAAGMLGGSVAISVPPMGIAINDWVTCEPIELFEVRDIVDREAYRPGLPFQAPPAVLVSGPARLLHSPLAKTAHHPGANDVVAAGLRIEPNAAEDHVLQQLTVGFIGPDFLQGSGIRDGEVRLVRDVDGSGTMTNGDIVLATALAPATDGTVTFANIDATVPRNQATRLLVVLDIDEVAQTGWQFRVTLQGAGSATLRGVDSDTIDPTQIGTQSTPWHTVAFPTLRIYRPLANSSPGSGSVPILPGARPYPISYFGLGWQNEHLELHALEFGLEGTALDHVEAGQFRLFGNFSGYPANDEVGLGVEFELQADKQLLVAHFDPPRYIPPNPGVEYYVWWLPDPETPLGLTLRARLPGYEPGTQQLRAGATAFGAQTGVPAVVQLPSSSSNGFAGVVRSPVETQQGRLMLSHLQIPPFIPSRTITYPLAASPVELWAFTLWATLEPHQLETFAFEVEHLEGDVSEILAPATFRLYRQFNYQQQHILDPHDLLLGEGNYNSITGRIEFAFGEESDPYLDSTTSSGATLGSGILLVSDFPFLGSGQKAFRLTMPSDDLLQATGTISGLPSPVMRQPDSGDTDPAILYSPNHTILGAPVMDDAEAWAIY